MKIPLHPGLPFILVCVLLDILGIGLIVPVLPQLVGKLAGDSASQAWWLGAMLVSYGLMQFCFAPTLGALSDRFGRRPLLLLGIFGLCIMFLVPALSLSLPIILASRFVGGMFSANIAVAQAYIADITPSSKRSAAFGMLGACFGIGFILGPLIGGVLGEQDLRYPFFLAAALSGLNFLYGLFVLPESLSLYNRTPFSFRRCNPLSALLNLSKLKRVGLLVGVIAISSFAQSMLHSTWTLYTDYRYGWTPFDIGISLVCIGVVSVVMQGFLMRFFIRQFGEKKVVLSGLLTGALAYVGFGLVTKGAWLYVIIFLNFMSVAVPPTLNGLVSENASAGDQGVSLGAISALNSVMGVLAPVIGTPLLVHTVHQNPESMLSGLVYFICAGLLLGAFFLALRQFKTLDNSQKMEPL